MGITDTSTPFGAFALPAEREVKRFAAERMGDDRMGRWMISLRRKQAVRGMKEPYDVSVADGVKARLYPSTNRCEKRALCGVQIWDTVERETLKNAVEAGSDPFIFLDIGANVGLYSLFVNAYAKAADRDVRIIAVEPSQEMGERLRFNAQASEAAIEHIASAISDKAGVAKLSDGGANRGEGALSETGEPVPVETLLGLIDRLKIDHIDALKIDIEGHDERALLAFFAEAAHALHPDIIIVEMDENDSALVELITAQNYLLAERTRLNAIFRKTR